MKREDIKPGKQFNHKEERKVPHKHIVLYVALHTDNGEHMVIHRPTHKTEIIYCEPIDHFMNRFALA